VKFGVVQFPGSCDHRDALDAARRVGDAQLLWHGDHSLDGIDAVIVPGGFSYGDYLRVGAIARFSPLMESVIAFAGDGGPVLGICNGFQVLCEAHLLPGALLPNTSLRFVCRQVDIEVPHVNDRDVVTTRAATHGPQSGEQLVHPERLGHIVVGSGVQRLHLVRATGSPGQHDDRRRAPTAQAVDDLETVEVG